MGKCVPGKTARTFCLQCNKTGCVTGYVAPIVLMQCPVCGAEWKSISAICEKCRRPSGDPRPSECAYCQPHKKVKRDVKQSESNYYTATVGEPDSLWG